MEVPKEPPSSLKYVYYWYSELHAQRGSGFTVPDAISFTDIAAWCMLWGIRLATHELNLLIQIDQIFLAEARAAAKRNAKKK